MNELFGLSISEGQFSNILARSREPLLDAASTIEQGRKARQPRGLLR